MTTEQLLIDLITWAISACIGLLVGAVFLKSMDIVERFNVRRKFNKIIQCEDWTPRQGR